MAFDPQLGYDPEEWEECPAADHLFAFSLPTRIVLSVAALLLSALFFWTLEARKTWSREERRESILSVATPLVKEAIQRRASEATSAFWSAIGRRSMDGGSMGQPQNAQLLDLGMVAEETERKQRSRSSSAARRHGNSKKTSLSEKEKAQLDAWNLEVERVAEGCLLGQQTDNAESLPISTIILSPVTPAPDEVAEQEVLSTNPETVDDPLLHSSLLRPLTSNKPVRLECTTPPSTPQAGIVHSRGAAHGVEPLSQHRQQLAVADLEEKLAEMEALAESMGGEARGRSQQQEVGEVPSAIVLTPECEANPLPSVRGGDFNHDGSANNNDNGFVKVESQDFLLEPAKSATILGLEAPQQSAEGYSNAALERNKEQKEVGHPLEGPEELGYHDDQQQQSPYEERSDYCADRQLHPDTPSHLQAVTPSEETKEAAGNGGEKQPSSVVAGADGSGGSIASSISIPPSPLLLEESGEDNGTCIIHPVPLVEQQLGGENENPREGHMDQREPASGLSVLHPTVLNSLQGVATTTAGEVKCENQQLGIAEEESKLQGLLQELDIKSDAEVGATPDTDATFAVTQSLGKHNPPEGAVESLILLPAEKEKDAEEGDVVEFTASRLVPIQGTNEEANDDNEKTPYDMADEADAAPKMEENRQKAAAGRLEFPTQWKKPMVTGTPQVVGEVVVVEEGMLESNGGIDVQRQRATKEHPTAIGKAYTSRPMPSNAAVGGLANREQQDAILMIEEAKERGRGGGDAEWLHGGTRSGAASAEPTSRLVKTCEAFGEQGQENAAIRKKEIEQQQQPLMVDEAEDAITYAPEIQSEEIPPDQLSQNSLNLVENIATDDTDEGSMRGISPVKRVGIPTGASPGFRRPVPIAEEWDELEIDRVERTGQKSERLRRTPSPRLPSVTRAAKRPSAPYFLTTSGLGPPTLGFDTDSTPSTSLSANLLTSSLLNALGVSSTQEMLLKLTSLDTLSDAMRKAGLESTNLIFGIDYTASNKYQGERSFGGRSLHSVDDPLAENPYQQVIKIMGHTLAPFAAPEVGIPVFGFGDSTTGDWSVFSLSGPEGECKDLDEVLRVYNEVTPYVDLSGPTNFAPLIQKAVELCKRVQDYHILVIIADGQVTNERSTRRAIVNACQYPLSIIVVGVGDGPWEMMRVFDESLPKRAWDNFHFVEFNEIVSGDEPLTEENVNAAELAFAIHSLLEIPDQYNYCRRAGMLDRRPTSGSSRQTPLMGRGDDEYMNAAIAEPTMTTAQGCEVETDV